MKSTNQVAHKPPRINLVGSTEINKPVEQPYQQDQTSVFAFYDPQHQLNERSRERNCRFINETKTRTTSNLRLVLSMSEMRQKLKEISVTNVSPTISHLHAFGLDTIPVVIKNKDI